MVVPSVTGSPPPLLAHGISHAGRKRPQNEDAFGTFIEEGLFVVADGMGGHSAGEVASHLAVEEIASFFRNFHRDPGQKWPYPANEKLSLGANLLVVGIKVANDKIRAAAESDRSLTKMACTAVMLAIGEGHLSVAHAGDARGYRFRDGQLVRLTNDHSILAEMIAARPDIGEAEISAFSHRNVVTKALGSKPDIEPTITSQSFSHNDLYLLCSDGLWTSVSDEAIADILRSTEELDVACQLLIDAANDAGGFDNITALIVRVGAGAEMP